MQRQVARSVLLPHLAVWAGPCPWRHVLGLALRPLGARAQFAFNTLSRVSPVSHGVCNVVKRVVIIGTSVVFFGTTLTTKTKLGAARVGP